MLCIRLDLAQEVSVVSRYMANPRKEQWQFVKRIFWYLKGTTDIGLFYHGDMSYALTSYLDSDYATDLDGRRSTIGYTFTFGNSLVSWKATIQPIVALSITKAEYMALEKAIKEGI